MDSEQHIFWFGPPSLIFLKICQMVICPVRRTYNHLSIFLFSNTKKALNYQVEQYLRLLNSPYLFRISQLTEKLQFISRICQMVTSTISGTCHPDANLATVNSFRNIFSMPSTETTIVLRL